MRSPNHHLIRLVALTTITCGFAVGHAHETDKGVERAEKLGTINFANSCLPDAQPRIERAMGTLHSFWYPETLKAFGVSISTEH